MRPHKEKRKRRSETGRRGIFTIQWQKTLQVCSTTTLKTELVNDELGNLAEEISKECIGSIDWFIPATNNEMQVERD